MCNCIHVHSPHMGSALYMHGSMGINCRMFAPTTFKVFRRLCIYHTAGFVSNVLICANYARCYELADILFTQAGTLILWFQLNHYCKWHSPISCGMTNLSLFYLTSTSREQTFCFLEVPYLKGLSTLISSQ